MLYFAYGSNMCRAVMGRHAANARPLGRAVLPNFRFLITSDGYASVAPRRGSAVHGMLWAITASDRRTLDEWEGVRTGLYRPAFLPIRARGQRLAALVYLGRLRRAGAPKLGYIEMVADGAREWRLPAPYISSLLIWARAPGTFRRGIGEFRWT
jgi:cation transport regulator ChaC